MDVKPGYKKTDIGIIPEDWHIAQLGEVGEALIGLTYKPTDVKPHGTLVLRSSNIQNDKLTLDDNVFVDTAIPERIKVRPGDVLVCVRNGSRDLIGKTVLLDARAEGMTFGAFMAVYRSPLGKLVNFLFQSRVLKHQIHEHLGATINQITNKSLNSFLIPVPPTETEQEAIAEILNDVDAYIDSLEQLIAKKRQIKQSAMQEFFRPKKGYLEKKLNEICSIAKERFDPFLADTEKECVELEHVSSRTGRLLGSVTTRGLRSQKTVFKKGDILFGKLRPYLRKYWYATYDGVCSTEFWVIRPYADIDSNWLYWLIQTDQIVNEANKSTGTKMPRAEWETVNRTEISVPPNKQEQVKIAAILSDMDAEITALEAKLDKARQVKQGMMQELLTGRTRLI